MWRLEDAQARIADVRAAFAAVVAQDASRTPFDAAWPARMRAAGTEADRLKQAGVWTTGTASLLHELGLHRSELHMTRALAWLLRPDGRHGLGTQPLDALGRALGLEAAWSGARVVLEESRPTEAARPGEPPVTRADLVVRTRDLTLVVEAKVAAGEQDTQLDRLARTWAYDPRPVLVFLTRAGQVPRTHGDAPWLTLTWAQVAAAFETVVVAPRPAALQEFITTVEAGLA